jgi:hypothetical protein
VNEEATQPNIRNASMKRVVLESPYRATEKVSLVTHVAYARLCVKHSLSQGEAPLASHLLYTQEGILVDALLEERLKGMWAGWTWFSSAEQLVVYTDFGISAGMKQGIYCASELRLPIVHRSIAHLMNQFPLN